MQYKVGILYIDSNYNYTETENQLNFHMAPLTTFWKVALI